MSWDEEMLEPAKPRPLSEVEIACISLAYGDVVPNNPALEVLMYPSVLPRTCGATAICRLLTVNGWAGAWTFTVYPFQHFHPNAHEVLVVASGSAELQLGGPEGDIYPVTAGDALILPAGTGHCRIEATSSFSICGAYPLGQENYETVNVDYPDPHIDYTGMSARIATVPLPVTDPIYGPNGPLTEIWT